MKKKFVHIIPLHKRIVNKISFWFWWNFKATENQKCQHDMILFGTAITKHGKRIDPRKLIISSEDN